MKKIVLIIMLCCMSWVQAAEVRIGPMAGANSMRSSKIWLQTDASASVEIAFWPIGKPEQKLLSPSILTQADDDFTALFDLVSLEPGMEYAYQVVLDGSVSNKLPTLKFHTQKLWQWRENPPNFTLMTGSCSYINEAVYDRPGNGYGNHYGIFNAMAKREPELMLWLGDNVYYREVDYMSPDDLHLRYLHDRAIPELQPLLQTGHHLAIWDDHDFGPNNSNSSYVFKEKALELFKQNWANASYGFSDHPGIYGQFSYNDVDLFLLDNRYYRDHDEMPDSPDKVLFGKQQMRWLKNALMTSTAPFKIIASGGQSINDHNRWEGWINFPDERKDFYQWLEQTRVEGVFFLAGDRHHTELLKVERDNAYPLYELTCSPLTSGSHSVKAEQDKDTVVRGTTVIGERNFCEIGFSGPRKDRQMNIRVFDKAGKQLWEKVLKQSLLRNPKPKKTKQ